jgi:hypothetical protein
MQFELNAKQRKKQVMNNPNLMQGMSVQHLRFEVQPLESIVFGNQPGTAIRGALYEALSSNFCSEPGEPITPNHKEHCPVCWLLDRENMQDERGQKLPRPITVEPPPLNQDVYNPQDKLFFGISLIGGAQNLMPYVLRAVQKMGDIGLGKGRGRFKLIDILETNPIFDVKRGLLDGNTVQKPTLQVTASRIDEAAQMLPQKHITLDLITPMRLTAQGKLMKYADPSIFIHRLWERAQRLAAYYSENYDYVPDLWDEQKDELLACADALTLAYDETEWYEVHSGSRRQNRYTPISGIIGRIRWEGNIEPLLPWLLWGQSLHVGKDAVKGNGWYRILHK